MLTSWLNTQQCGSGAPLQFTAGLLLGRPLLPVGSMLEAPPRRATDVASLRRGGQGEDSSKICHIHRNAEGRVGCPRPLLPAGVSSSLRVPGRTWEGHREQTQREMIRIVPAVLPLCLPPSPNKASRGKSCLNKMNVDCVFLQTVTTEV